MATIETITEPPVEVDPRELSLESADRLHQVRRDPPAQSSPSVASPTVASSSQQAPVNARRVLSIDILRGLVMLLMLIEMTELTHYAEQFKHPIGQFIHRHTSHVDWFGTSLHDLIQPGFTFLVGTAMAFSLAARRRTGQSFGRMAWHAATRSLILIALGVFLRSLDSPQTNFRFDDTLTQIGLGYFFLFLIAQASSRWVVAAITIICIGYTAAFITYPAPAANFDYEAVGVAEDWPYHRDGLAAHYNKNSNVAWAIDRWWMNLFPRDERFVSMGGGYATSNAIPTLATMLFGLLAGRWLRDETTVRRRNLLFITAAAVGFAVAIVCDVTGVCPIIKRIWTPSWVLFSGAWCFLILLGLHWICDLRGWTAWSYPVRVIGANSIAAYLMAWIAAPWLIENFHRHLDWAILPIASSLPHAEHASVLIAGVLALMSIYGILLWMYKRSILLRI